MLAAHMSALRVVRAVGGAAFRRFGGVQPHTRRGDMSAMCHKKRNALV